MTNFRLSELKQSADDNFEFDENTRKYTKWVENTVGKGEIACYEQFLLFPLCFQKACFPGVSFCMNGLNKIMMQVEGGRGRWGMVVLGLLEDNTR